MRCVEFSGAHEPVGELVQESPLWLMGGSPDGVPKAVSGIHAPLICSIPNPGCCSSSTAVDSQVIQFMTECSG